MARAPSIRNDNGLPPRNPKGGRPSREVAAKLESHIIDIALEQFVAGGVEATSMETIATAAKVSKRTLYEKFGSKRTLLIAAVQQGIARQVMPIAANIPGGSPRDRLATVALTMLDASLKPEIIGLEALMRWLITNEPEPGEAQSLMGAGAGTDVFQAVLAQCGEVTEDAQPFMASLLFDTLVTAPRIRITIRRDLEDTPEAKTTHILRTIDFLALALPSLAADRGAAAR